MSSSNVIHLPPVYRMLACERCKKWFTHIYDGSVVYCKTCKAAVGVQRWFNTKRAQEVLNEKPPTYVKKEVQEKLPFGRKDSSEEC